MATITGNTVDPLFSTSEKLDSLSIRYVQVGASPPDFVGITFSSGPTLNQPGVLVQPVIQDSLLDGEDYHLQIVAVDFAGNATVTDPEKLRFKDEFDNPVADSFMVALPEDLQGRRGSRRQIRVGVDGARFGVDQCGGRKRQGGCLQRHIAGTP